MTARLSDIESPDRLDRKVLVAVELYDPIAQALVSEGVGVKAVGLANGPIVNLSGRFVWLVEDDAWPTAIAVDPGRLPFASHTEPAPPRPDPGATPKDRLVRITLRPTPVYRFGPGVTAIYGRLCERAQDGSPALPGVRVQLAWWDVHSEQWLPPPPHDDATDPDAPRSPREVETDENGEFAAFLRLSTTLPTEPDVERGLLLVRLQFTRFPGNFLTRVTPKDFPFLQPVAPKRNGRVPEGRPLERYLTLGWDELIPI
jgi:hypothetical protein